MPKYLLPAIALLVASGGPVAASTDDSGERDLDTRIKRYDVTYTIQPDGAYVEDREWSLVILKERAVSGSPTCGSA
jgi:hypothetical protein